MPKDSIIKPGMVNIFTEIIINESIDRVADYTANPDNAPEWYVNNELSRNRAYEVSKRILIQYDPELRSNKLIYPDTLSYRDSFNLQYSMHFPE